MPPVFDEEKCISCGICVRDCPAYILKINKKEKTAPVIIEEYKDECWHCGNCRISCPKGAISFEFPLYTLV